MEDQVSLHQPPLELDRLDLDHLLDLELEVVFPVEAVAVVEAVQALFRLGDRINSSLEYLSQ